MTYESGNTLGYKHSSFQSKNIMSSQTPRLKEAEEARSICISIENLECAGELSSALTAHASAMTEVYRDLLKLTNANVNDEDQYAVLFSRAASFTTWYKARKKIANSMKLAASSQ